MATKQKKKDNGFLSFLGDVGKNVNKAVTAFNKSPVSKVVDPTGMLNPGEKLNFLKETAQAIPRGFDSLTRSVAEAGASGLAGATGVKASGTGILDDKKKPTILGIPGSEDAAKFLYGDAPVQSIQSQVKGVQDTAEKSKNPIVKGAAPLSPFLAPVIAGADAAGLVGTGAAVKVGSKIAAKEIPKAVEKVNEATVANHPTIRQLDDHLAGINASRDHLSALGLPSNAPAVVKNAQAYTDTLKLRNETAQQIRERGSINPSNTPDAPLTNLPGQVDAEQIAKATNPAEVKKAIGDTLPPDVVQKIAPALAHTKDPNVVKNIVNRFEPKPPPISMLPAKPVEAPPVNIVDATVPKQRGFLESAQNAENINPEVKQGISGLPQTYEPKQNEKLFSTTKKYVDENPTAALHKVYENADTPAKHDENVAIGGHLIQKAQQEGRVEDAVRIAERLDTQGRELGRGVQAFAGLTRLNPEGVLVYAQKLIRKSREGQKSFTKEASTVQDIKQQVESAAQDTKSVQKNIRATIQQIAKEKPKESTGEKLAKNVDKAAQPAVKKKADILVAELTKKVKQEYLEPKVGTKKQPLDVLKEVFGRHAEAKEAYPLAQQILRDKYKDVPTMQKALDKFFGSEIGLPAANTTINNAIKDELKKNGTRISETIYKSWANQKTTVEDITSALTKEGFDKESAQTLAKEVKGRLDTQLHQAKIDTLNRLSGGVSSKNQQTYIDKVQKLSNLGGLDDSDYIDLARAKLKLPNLKADAAKRLSELAQKAQSLPAGAEKYATTRQIKQLIQENTPLTKGQKVSQLAATPRALMTSGDVSFGGRQGLLYATTHPIKFGKAWVKQFKYLKEGFQGDDSKAFDKLMGGIQAHPDYNILEKTDLAISDPHSISPNASEEQFIGNHYAEKVPLLGRVVRGSNYAFTGLANTLRAGEFYDQIAKTRAAGIPITDKVANDLAKVINNSTGRGDFGHYLENHAKTLSTTFFSPRLMASRINIFNPFYYSKLSKPAKKEAIRQFVSLGAYAVGILGIAKASGAEVGLDPTSANFGKIKVGDTRFDVLGGFASYIRLAAQLGSGHITSSTTGHKSDIYSGKFGSSNPYDVITGFLENKENPTLAFLTQFAKGKDISGNDTRNPQALATNTGKLFVPLGLQDFADNLSHKNSANPIITSAASAIGIGTQTYGKQDLQVTGKQQEYLDTLKKQKSPQAQINASKDFFQTLKVGPDRKEASAAIRALKDGNGDFTDTNLAKAQKIADEYNKQYRANFKDWAKKYGKYATDDTLVGEYEKGLIGD